MKKFFIFFQKCPRLFKINFQNQKYLPAAESDDHAGNRGHSLFRLQANTSPQPDPRSRTHVSRCDAGDSFTCGSEFVGIGLRLFGHSQHFSLSNMGEDGTKIVGSESPAIAPQPELPQFLFVGGGGALYGGRLDGGGFVVEHEVGIQGYVFEILG